MHGLSRRAERNLFVGEDDSFKAPRARLAGEPRRRGRRRIKTDQLASRRAERRLDAVEAIDLRDVARGAILAARRRAGAARRALFLIAALRGRADVAGCAASFVARQEGSLKTLRLYHVHRGRAIPPTCRNPPKLFELT